MINVSRNTSWIYVKFLRQRERKRRKQRPQHNDDDLDWMYRPYLYMNTKTNYDSSPMEGELPS